MNRVTISESEYKKLLSLALKRGIIGLKNLEKKRFLSAGFGIFKNTFGRSNSVNIVNKMRKSWRK